MKTQLLRIKFISTAALLAILLLSCGKKENRHANSTPTKVTVKTAIAHLSDYPEVYSFSGKLEAAKQSKLSTRLMGQVSRIYVKPGQKVNKGDLLVQIRNQDILAKKAQLAASKSEATTAFESAERDRKRFEALYASNSVSEKEIDDIRTRYNQSKARLEAVKQMEHEVTENIRYASICAPYRGIVTDKFVQEGEMASPGMPLLGMESPSKWKVIARIPESDIAKLSLGDTVKLQFNAAAAVLNGVIVEINPSADNSGNQYHVKILVLIPGNYPVKLYSGMYASVLFEHGTQKRILVPLKSLVYRGQLVGIYAVSQSGNALLRWVKTGKTFNRSIEIISGLSDGEKFVESADSKLFDGAPIVSK